MLGDQSCCIVSCYTEVLVVSNIKYEIFLKPSNSHDFGAITKSGSDLGDEGIS